jgi:hypothetical protein
MRRDQHRGPVAAGIRIGRGLARVKFFSKHCFCFQADTRASFSRQENFFVVIENLIHFFLVAFATDF